MLARHWEGSDAFGEEDVFGCPCAITYHRGSCAERSAKNDVFYLAFPKIGAGYAASYVVTKLESVLVRGELCHRLGRNPAPGARRARLSPARDFALWHAEKCHPDSKC